MHFRHVHDYFILTKNYKYSERFFKKLNNAKKSKKLRIEKEKNSELPFIDILVKKINHELKRTFFRKNTFTDNYKNFKSHVSMK